MGLRSDDDTGHMTGPHETLALIRRAESAEAEVTRLRAVLTELAERFCETPVGFFAERALMTPSQRAAVDAQRSTSARPSDE